eukprot:Lankesteria_metandrocarpae@DN9421_c0_g1_i1.p1
MDTQSNSPEAWYKGLPSLTRLIGTATFLVTVAVVWGVLDVRLLLLDWRLVYKKIHLWRLITDYCFIGKFSFGWVFQMYFFVSFSSKLESSDYFSAASRNPRGSYLYFILIQMLTLNLVTLIMYWPTGRFLLGPALHFAIIYYWSRCEPWAKVGLWGFSLDAYQLPFALLFLDLLIGGSLQDDLFGLFSGHIYYFVRNVVPGQYGIDLFSKPPAFLDTVAHFIDDFSLRQLMSRRGTGTGTDTAANRPSGARITTLHGNQNSNSTSTNDTASSSAFSSGGGFFRRRNEGLYSGTGRRLGSAATGTNNGGTGTGGDTNNGGTGTGSNTNNTSNGQ